VVRKFRAEGMQKGTNMITDAWTFANMKMMVSLSCQHDLRDTKAHKHPKATTPRSNMTCSVCAYMFVVAGFVCIACLDDLHAFVLHLGEGRQPRRPRADLGENHYPPCPVLLRLAPA
jgi:hypothetical protein